VAGIDGAVAAIDKVAALDRADVRAVAADRFSQDRMVDAYVDVYREVLRGSDTP